MISMTIAMPSTAPTGPGAGRVAARPLGSAVLRAGSALAERGSAGTPTRRRAPEAFTAPFRGTGLPVAGRTVAGHTVDVLPATCTVPADVPAQQQPITYTDPTTLGIHSPGRPQS
ncbi:hypothetical protein OF117_04750 [Geodermatophilus sp. YIM 151500]|uniref:hypothetical protein n=1 Tax=Geodermatophilus sp. YIM 151500 TaxID=2984531 RepID=UPI0021E48B81|nr:hypothetical protein [Geodermatophilus sp. YIM 151500]MCV2488664.1 hypothetical protein [Geodermatophilus sp. YIM 151500]